MPCPAFLLNNRLTETGELSKLVQKNLRSIESKKYVLPLAMRKTHPF